VNKNNQPSLHNTLASVLLTVFLLALCTWGEIAIEDIAGVNRPYTIFYLIPVAVGAALLGIRGGILSALAAVLLARLYLFTDNKHGFGARPSRPTRDKEGRPGDPPPGSKAPDSTTRNCAAPTLARRACRGRRWPARSFKERT